MLDDAGLRCCALSTPLLKCIAPGFKPIERVKFDISEAAKTFPIPVAEQYDRSVEMLERSIEAASILGCNIVRCFSFWRTEDPRFGLPAAAREARRAGRRWRRRSA